MFRRLREWYRKSGLRPWVWAAGMLAVTVGSALIGAFRRGIRLGRAEGKYEADLDRIDEIVDSGDTKRMRDDLVRRIK